MALLPTEQKSGEFVVLIATGALSVTRNLTGAVVWGGFLRDPDGRLVIA